MIDEESDHRYLGGEESGLEELMRKWSSFLTLYINGYLHDVRETEVLMIEVFFYLLTRNPWIRDSGLNAYLYQSVRHMALRHKSRLRPCFSLGDLAREPEGKALIEEAVRTKERNRILHYAWSM